VPADTAANKLHTTTGTHPAQPGTQLAHNWHTPGTCMAQIWHKPGTTWHTHRSTFRGSHGILAQTWHKPGTNLAQTWHKPGTHLAHIWHIPGTSLAPIWHGLGRSLAQIRHIGGRPRAHVGPHPPCATVLRLTPRPGLPEKSCDGLLAGRPRGEIRRGPERVASLSLPRRPPPRPPANSPGRCGN
jgi:hypothetical protein